MSVRRKILVSGLVLALGLMLVQTALAAQPVAAGEKSAKEIMAEAEANRPIVTMAPITAPPVKDAMEAAPLSPLVVLYDQTANLNSNGTSQNFEAAYDAYDNQAADDFLVNAGGGWSVTEVYAPGVYSPTHGSPQSMRVAFYQDAAGSPGAILCDYPALAYVENPVGTFTMTLPSTCYLGPGLKWVSVVANLNFGGGGGQWFWSTRTVLTNAASRWQNPGNGFGTGCVTWGVRTSCLTGQTDPDMTFRLSGSIASCTTDPDCNDGNACNGVETCVNNVCVPGTPVNCDDGQVCTLDTCNPATGQCSYAPNPCSDGDSCTRDSCDNVLGCQHTPLTPIRLCNTAAITIPSSGTGTPYPSSIAVSGLSTTASLCSVELLGLSHTWPSDIDILLGGPLGGASNAIIMSDAGGTTAVTGANLVLKDAAAATIPTPLVSGTYKPTNVGTGDVFAAPAPTPAGGSALSVFDGTNPNGTWQLFVVDDAAGDSGSLAGGWCVNIVVGGCSTDPECSDGNPCNGIETCVGGSCVPGTPINCDDGQFCTLDSCVPATGLCAYAPNPCDDGNGCTADSCDNTTGCSNTYACSTFCNFDGMLINDSTSSPTAATPYPSGLDVSGLGSQAVLGSVELLALSHTYPDDIDMMLVGPAGGAQNALIVSDVGGDPDLVAVNLVLTDGAAAALADGGPIVSGTYKPTNVGTGDTFPAPAPAPAGGSALSVFSGNLNGTWNLFVVDDAGTDSGELVVWCLNIRPVCASAQDCDDGNPCTTDVCGPGGACAHANAPDNTPCSDGLYCTVGDTCQSGVCSGSQRDCSDSNQCTDDTCDESQDTCLHGIATGAACDDGNLCTTNDTCTNQGLCVGTPARPGLTLNAQFQSNKTVLQWNPPGVGVPPFTYSVVRGPMTSLPVGSGPGEACIEPSLAIPQATDLAVPAAGTGYWYISRARDLCGTGSYGYQGLTGGAPGPERITGTCP